MKKGKGSPKGSKNPKVPTTIDLEDLDPSQLLAPTIEVPGLKREGKKNRLFYSKKRNQGTDEKNFSLFVVYYSRKH
jgi:hypothetical protein